MVYAHREQLAGGKWCGKFFRLSAGADNGEIAYFARAKGTALAQARPGCIIQASASTANTIDLNTAKIVGMIDDDGIISQWSAIEAANKAAERAEKELRGSMSRNRMHDRMQPIREAYLGMSASKRAQLLAQVVRFIVEGK